MLQRDLKHVGLPISLYTDTQPEDLKYRAAHSRHDESGSFTDRDAVEIECVLNGDALSTHFIPIVHIKRGNGYEYEQILLP